MNVVSSDEPKGSVRQGESVESALRQARQLADELLERVRRLLMMELEKGGYEGAVRVCSEIAQEIPREIEARTGASIRRVSLRYRNPKDIPDEYERRKLEEFEQQHRARALVDESVEVVREDGRTYLRYMRPILVGPMCITCHGPKEAIPSSVRAILAERYPDDRATGYRSGDVRGAVSVKIPLGTP
uniref:Cytochrome c family protein n=1 Tax=uncultured Acidobacteriota bacterium TaxID=171953 RepID=H5SQ34_9BACT|nr:cytochrome c family protein [uncultured Acidobacteriota bacterium]